jgi:hypothetical protein
MNQFKCIMNKTNAAKDSEKSVWVHVKLFTEEYNIAYCQSK